MSINMKKIERIQINNLMIHIKLLDKQKQVKSKISRWKETVMIKVEIS
jgi:hypothetical protein